jgi:hypothetical protein
MSNERKEGVVIAALCLVILAIFLLCTTWYESAGGVPATVYLFNGIEKSCIPNGDDCGWIGKKVLYLVAFELNTGLLVLVPVFAYGLLRSFGIIKRLFVWEKKVFGSIMKADEK